MYWWGQTYALGSPFRIPMVRAYACINYVDAIFSFPRPFMPLNLTIVNGLLKRIAQNRTYTTVQMFTKIG
jgi:hypothetical protein